MYANDVLKYCIAHGVKLTRQALYNAGRKHGFMTKNEDTNRYDFDQEGFLKWLNAEGGKAKRFMIPPEGYITVKEFRDKYNVPLNYAYSICQSKEACGVYVGEGKVGKLYVDEGKVAELVAKGRPKRGYDWGEECNGTDKV